MGVMASQITSLTIVYSIIYSGTDQRKHQISASLAFVRGIHRGPVNSPHKRPVTRKMFPFDDVIMEYLKSVPSRPKIWWRNSPVSQLFFPCGEQPEYCLLAHKSEQPTAGCIAIFHKTCIITNLDLWNPWGYVTDMSKWQGAGVWSMDENILHFIFQNM